jgi:hypothetical protein
MNYKNFFIILFVMVYILILFQIEIEIILLMDKVSNYLLN